MATRPSLAARAVVASALAVAASLALAASALGDPPAYDIRGTWTNLSPQGDTLGTAEFTTMDLCSGRFSGTYTPTSGSPVFTVAGTESGARMDYTTSTGSYVATDTVTLTTLPDGRFVGDGSFTDTNGNHATYRIEETAPRPGPACAGRASATQVLCDRDAITGGFTCTAQVGDAGDSQPRRTPTGTVHFTAPSGGFPTGDTCTLQAGSGSVASCSVAFDAAAGSTPTGTPPPVTGTYPGDDTFAASSATDSMIMAGPAPDPAPTQPPAPDPGGCPSSRSLGAGRQLTPQAGGGPASCYGQVVGRIDAVKGTGPLYVKHPGSDALVPIGQGDPVYEGDVITGPKGSAASVQFLLGGRTGVKGGDAPVEIGERNGHSVAPGLKQNVVHILTILEKAAMQKTPVLIQTNGGIIGVKG